MSFELEIPGSDEELLVELDGESELSVDVVDESEMSSFAAHAANPPVSTMPVAAKAAKWRRDRETRAARELSAEFFMTQASPNVHHGHLSPTSNAGQMSL